MLKKHPYVSFFVLMVLFCAIETGLTRLITLFGEMGLAVVVFLGYFAQLIAVITPFFMIGGVAFLLCERPFFQSLPLFGIFTAVKLFTQFPLSILHYSEDLSSSFGYILLVYLTKELLSCAVLFLILLLGYLLFMRRETTHEVVFFGFRGSDTRMLSLGVGLITLQHLAVFVTSFLEHLKEKLWMFDGGDLADLIFSLLFIALRALLAYAIGRLAMRLLYPLPKAEEE